MTTRLWRDVHRLVEIGYAAPQVAAIRCARMMAAGATPGRRDREEFRRMGAEKADAFGQVWTAMSLEAWSYSVRFWLAVAKTTPFSMVALPAPNWLGRALAPVHRAVRSNHRRLTRRRNPAKR